MAIARVQSKTGSAIGATSLAVTLDSTPVNGNFLVCAVGSLTNLNAVTSISQTGATWVQAVEKSYFIGGLTVEIWYAENVSGASTSITVNLDSSLTVAAVFVEYSGIRAASSLDQTANNTGTETADPDSGTTSTTTQADELWIAGLAIDQSTTVFSAPTNSFSEVAEIATTGLDVVLEEKIVSSTGTANTSAATSPHGITEFWTGAIATFKGGDLRRIIVIS